MFRLEEFLLFQAVARTEMGLKAAATVLFLGFDAEAQILKVLEDFRTVAARSFRKPRLSVTI